MKAILVLLLFLIPISNSSSQVEVFPDDEIINSMDREIITDPMTKIIGDLEKAIDKSHEESLKKVPASYREKILTCDNPEKMYDLSAEIFEWLTYTVGQVRDREVAEPLGLLIGTLRERGDELSGGFFSSTLTNTLWSKIHKRPLNVEGQIRDNVIYIREHSTPDVRLSPQGRAPIRWIWTLEIKQRRHGIMHVGLDEKKRTFICFERNVGVYFPEGGTLERIYREIVQNPVMAGDNFGTGREDTK